jgi:hypothetical protein
MLVPSSYIERDNDYNGGSENMRVLLVQLDGHRDKRHRNKQAFPNLALMKLSAYHKARGDEVGFNIAAPDRIYISCVFSKNLKQAAGVAKLATTNKDAEIYIGGPGTYHMGIKTGGLDKIDPCLDNIMPDYSLYKIKYSLGFTSRGCVRECPFCLVPQLEGAIREGTPIECFHQPDHKNIILLDNNFTASPTRQHTLDYIQERGLKVNFSQGLDVRLVDKEFAERLKKTRCYTWTFKHRALHFAWDLMGYEKQVIKGIENLLDAKYPRDYLQFYVLVGYNSTLVDDLYRIKTLTGYGITPYIMIYNDQKTPILDQMDRWVNLHLFKDLNLSDMKALTPKDRKTVEDAEWQAEWRVKNAS